MNLVCVYCNSECCLPALRASRQASYMSNLMSGLSSAMVSPTRTKRSTADWTARPTRPSARRDRSAFIGRSGADTNVVIYAATNNGRTQLVSRPSTHTGPISRLANPVVPSHLRPHLVLLRPPLARMLRAYILPPEEVVDFYCYDHGSQTHGFPGHGR